MGIEALVPQIIKDRQNYLAEQGIYFAGQPIREGEMNIGNLVIGKDRPCRIIAELSNAHNGSLATAHRLIEESVKAGADAIKFQAYLPEELVALRGDGKAPKPWHKMTMKELYTKAQTPHSWFPSLVGKCESLGVPWFSSVFGPDSLEMLERLGCPVYKLASLDLEYQAWRRQVHMTGKPVIQSRPEMPDAIDSLSASLTLFCPPGYPQDVKPKQIEVGMKWADGFSFHGTDPVLPHFAYLAGAQLIEVHVQLDDEPSELEKNVSLTMTQLAELCDAVKPKKMARGHMKPRATSSTGSPKKRTRKTK